MTLVYPGVKTLRGNKPDAAGRGDLTECADTKVGRGAERIDSARGSGMRKSIHEVLVPASCRYLDGN